MAVEKTALAGKTNGSAPAPAPTPARSSRSRTAKSASTILIVDGEDISRRVLKAMLRTGPYRLIEAARPKEALGLIETEEVDLILIDLVMPEMNGAELCRRIKSNRKNQFVPILMLTNVGGSANEIEGIAAGADEFLTKPLHPEVVRTRVRAMLRNKAAIDSLEEAETILFALAQAVEARDEYTSNHCQRLADYSVGLGHALGLRENELIALHRGGFLHDIGKISIPDAILFKQGPLTDEEWRVMRSHTIKGEAICQPMKTLAPVLPIIRHHHERWDGTGYPDGLKGEGIPLLARILQIADVYDALTTARPYKPALTPEDAFRTMDEEARRGWRDLELLALFREICAHFPKPTAERKGPEWVNVTPMLQSLDAMRRHVNK